MLNRRRALPRPQDLIEELLVDRGLREGDQLPTEAELADQLGLGRSSVREALRALETLGVIEVRHGRGMFLRAASLDGLTASIAFWSRVHDQAGEPSLDAVQAVREALEVGLIGEAMAAASPDDLELMRTAVETMEAAAERGEPSASGDLAFHRALFAPMRNWVLLGLIDAFWRIREGATALPRLDRADYARIAAAHRDIYSAVVDGDTRAAVEAMRHHFTVGGA